MSLLFTRRWISFSITGLMLFAAAAAILCVSSSRARRPQDIREISAIRDEWERVVFGHALMGDARTMLADQKAKALTKAEKAAKIAHLAENCLAIADKHPNTSSELAALYLAAGRGSATDAGVKARDRLITRIATADLTQLDEAIKSSRVTGHDSLAAIVPAILDRIKQSSNHPRTAALLTHVCKTLGFGSESKEPPPHFAVAADLLVSNGATSTDISNFCETLGSGFGGPPWASQFEPHLRTILRVNHDRWVRCTASMAIASIAQSSVDRQEEAAKLYEQFVTDFDGQTAYASQAVEQELCRRAQLQLTAMTFAPVGRLAPEIEGVDLDGQPMTLTEYRGKVVLLSFWATWCGPCMKLIPHEQELARRFQDKPFAIVGVNGDESAERISDAVTKHQISWRSFRDTRNGARKVSDEWNALFPTIYLIDHKGSIRYRFSGAPSPEVLGPLVDKLVSEAKADQDDQGGRRL